MAWMSNYISWKKMGCNYSSMLFTEIDYVKDASEVNAMLADGET